MPITWPSPETRWPTCKRAHIGAELDDLAGIFVADRHRRRDRLLRPLVPVEDMDVGAADAGLVDLDQHVVRPDLGHRLVAAATGRARRLCLDQGLHALLLRCIR